MIDDFMIALRGPLKWRMWLWDEPANRHGAANILPASCLPSGVNHSFG
ncbi:hypothetical protein GALL_446780 [mine drainage metagenome]|uniref:Uncharacterized protein n=1 Tax=mine drainage metagenome TaxID=410659 RepID=A0A1J5PS95_9ZZZZ